MAEHTPGPWHLEIEADALHVYSPVEEVLHFSDAGWDEFTRATFEANARLIAAAPDLLAALEEIVRDYGYNLGMWAVHARAAIAKAIGTEITYDPHDLTRQLMADDDEYRSATGTETEPQT